MGYSSCAGLSRASIKRVSSRNWMDCRVGDRQGDRKPGSDEGELH